MKGGWKLELKLCSKPQTTFPDRIRQCDVLELIKLLKKKKACGIHGIQN
jgi:hypothetical protein